MQNRHAISGSHDLPWTATKGCISWGELVGSDKRTAVTFLIDTGTDVNYISDTTATKDGLPIKSLPESVKNRAPDGKPWQYVVVPSIVSDQLNMSRQVFYLLPANQLPNSRFPPEKKSL